MIQDKIYTTENWQEMLDAMHSGRTIEIGEDVFDYFLEVLPPVYMHARRIVGDGAERRERRVSFGFAEGAEPITAFWCEGKRTVEDGPDGGTLRCYCQRTAEMNRW